MDSRVLGIRILALVGAALITAFGVSPDDFVYYTGLALL